MNAPSPFRVADAPDDNWVDRYAPVAMRPWLRLSRADRPIGTWLLLLPCYLGLALAMMADRPVLHDIWIALACGIGAFVMRGAGCTWNDIADRDFDAAVARTRSRPLPSGQVSLRGAYLWLLAQVTVGAVVLLSLGQGAVMIGAASLLLVAAYPFAKRVTWWPQAVLGLAFNWGILLAYGAHMDGAGRPVLGLAPVLAWLAGVAWTIFYDTIYAHQDIEDDRMIGVKSTARLFGEQSHAWLALFGAGAVILFATAVWATSAGAMARGMALIGVAGFGAHLIWQWRRFTPKDGEKARVLFVANRDAGLILVLFWVAAAML